MIDLEYYEKSMNHPCMEISHAWSRSPEMKEILAVFHRTNEEHFFSLKDFETWEEAGHALGEIAERGNRGWMRARLGSNT